MSGRYVPWASWREWEDVRDSLFSDSAASVQNGVARVMGWRRRGKLPLGVDVSALLLATSLKDPGGPGPSLLLSVGAEMEASLQAEYCLTIIRLVNGVSDSCQKGKVAGSVAKNADSAGLHPMLVDIRHEATHNNVPSLHMLRLAASHSLSWLYSNYWSAQSDRTSAAASESLNVLERLLLNQSARAAVSAPSGLSSQQSDSEADGPDPSDAGMSPAALKKQQKALLGELRPIIPSSHAADLAHVLLRLAAKPPGELSDAIAQLPAARINGSSVSTLLLLSCSYDNLLSHVLVQCFSILQDAKRAIQLSRAEQQPPQCDTATDEAESGPSSSMIESAASWGTAALQASELAGDATAHQLRLAHGLQQLFRPAALFASRFPEHQQDTAMQDCANSVARLQKLYGSTSWKCSESVHGKGVAPAAGKRPAALEHESSPASGKRKPTKSLKTETSSSGASSGHTAAITAMLTAEDGLLRMCKVCCCCCCFLLLHTNAALLTPGARHCLRATLAPHSIDAWIC